MDDNEKWCLLAVEERALREEAERISLAAQATLQNEIAGRLEEQAQRKEEAKRTRPQTLLSYLESCHSFSLAVRIETNPFKVSKEPAGPFGRLYPQRIIPWLDFQTRQNDTWKQLADPSFTIGHEFPSQDTCSLSQSRIQPISCGAYLEMFGKEAIEKVVQVLIEAVNSNSLLRDRLGLRGKAKFYTHPSRFVDNDDAPEPNDVAHLFSWYCNCLTSDDAEIAKMVVEYIFPEELTPVVLIDGLMSEIQPARDVIENRDRDVMCTSRAHVTAAVTKVYSCMIDKGIQYGFICTGQSYVFLHIPDDPSIVYYHLSVPIVDVCDDDETRLYKTAAAQVFVFVLQSFLTDLPPQSWHDAAANIGVWPLNSEDAQSQIIESACNRKNSRASAQEAQRRRSFERSPIRTLSSCKQSEIQSDCKESGNEAACSLPHQAASSQSTPALQQGVAGQGRIQDRSYCTHACLLGLANGGPMDKDCPNADSHRPKHISSSKFLRLLQAQLANDRGPDADIIPLHMSGAIGALFKVRLSAYGYTLVAKGMTRLRLERLEHERDVYRVLRPIQGKHVAVCLGLKDLILPYYYHGRAFTHLLFLSWAGRPLDLCLKEVSEEALIAAVTEAYKSIHHLRIIHFDAEVRNITYDKAPMIVDFERSKYIKRDSLGTTGLDGQSRKRKSDTTQQQKVDHFARELSAVVDRVSECYDDLRPSKQ